MLYFFKLVDERSDEMTTNINWYPGHMAKTKRLIQDKLNLIDIIYELVDARIPYSSKIKDIDNLIKDKDKILIMTKSDLCDQEETNKWVMYYEKLGYNVLLVNLNNNKDYRKIIDLTHKITKEKQSKRKVKGIISTEIRALVIGIPNVGKSTLINKIAGKKAAGVANKPGVTKALSWIKTTHKISLLDTPGILWPKFDNEKTALNLAAMTAIKESILPIDQVAYYVLETLKTHYPHLLNKRYKIKHLPDDTIELYSLIAKNMGIKELQGDIDYEKVSLLVINDIKSGLISGITFDRVNN